MTSDVVAALFPTGEQADETVRLTIKALMKGRGLTVEEVARRADLGRSALYSKLSDSERVPFKAGEVATLARILRVSPGEIYDGLGGTFVPTPPDGGGYAIRDSNPEPADVRHLHADLQLWSAA